MRDYLICVQLDIKPRKSLSIFLLITPMILAAEGFILPISIGNLKANSHSDSAPGVPSTRDCHLAVDCDL